MRTAVFFDLTDTADDAFDRAIEVMLVLFMAFAPLALGAVQAWSEMVVIVLAASMALCLAIKLLRRPDVRFVWSWTYLPIVVFLSLVALQLLPLPVSVIKVISPHTAELKTSLLSTAKISPQHLLAMPISFYPEGTLHDLRLLLALAAVYVVTLNVVRQARQIQRLLQSLTIIGVAIALIAAAHVATRATHVYGFVGQTPSNWVVAPFINRNHFGQFMNLSLGVAAAVLMTSLDQFIHGFRRSALPTDQMLGQIPARIWMLAAAVVICAAGVFVSLSRGAMLSMGISAIVAAVVAWRHRMRVRVWATVPLIWLVVVMVVAFGFDRIATRLTTLEEHSGHARLQVARDVLEASKQFPLVGLGMGTFEVTYPMFDRSNWATLATHADDDVAQLLFETGMAGAATVLAFAVLVGWKYWRCVRSAPSPMASSAIGLGFGLLAVALHSFTDFGQHIPACAGLTSICCALLVTLAEASRQTSPESIGVVPALTVRKARLRLAARSAALGVLGIGSIAVTADAWTRARAERNWAAVSDLEPTIANRGWEADNNQYAMMLIPARRASELVPGDIHYRHWLNYYRWRYISQWRDPVNGEVLIDPADVAAATQYATQVVNDLLSQLWRCPTFGPSYLLAGQIETSLLGQTTRGSELIRTGYRLSRTDPAANFEAALLDAREGQWDSAMEKLRHAADLSPAYRSEGVHVLVRRMHRLDLALQLAGDDVSAVREILELVEASDDAAAIRDVRQRLRDLVRARAAPTDAPVDALADAARLAMADAGYPAAIEYYKRALNLNYASPQLHLELARALVAGGLRDEAIDEARTANRLGSRAAEALILELRLKPASTTAASSSAPSTSGIDSRRPDANSPTASESTVK